jgi:hypothetical protein
MPKRYVDVSHEALIRGWPRLRRWLDEDRTGLRLHRRITEAAEEWHCSNRDSDLLYRGTRLVQAQEWRERNEPELNAVEREFMDASMALKQRLEQQEKERQQHELDAALKLAETERQRADVEGKARRRQLYLIIVLFGLAVVASAAAVFGFRQKVDAERQARLATEAQQTAEKQAVLARAAEYKAKEAASQANVFLALNSNAIGNDSQELAYLAKALKLNPRNFEAGALTAALLTQKSWPVVTGAMKHDGVVISAQFSADGQRVVTASWGDKTARVWDAATGKAIGEPMKHDGVVRSAQFSADGQRVVTASLDKTARVWDAATGKAIGEPMKPIGAEVRGHDHAGAGPFTDNAAFKFCHEANHLPHGAACRRLGVDCFRERFEFHAALFEVVEGRHLHQVGESSQLGLPA